MGLKFTFLKVPALLIKSMNCPLTPNYGGTRQSKVPPFRGGFRGHHYEGKNEFIPGFSNAKVPLNGKFLFIFAFCILSGVMQLMHEFYNN